MTDLLQILAAGIGTVAFGALFGVPSKYYPYCGLIGASGWAVYVFLWMRTGFWSEAVVVFLATVLVILMSRFFAVRELQAFKEHLAELLGGVDVERAARFLIDVLLQRFELRLHFAAEGCEGICVHAHAGVLHAREHGAEGKFHIIIKLVQLALLKFGGKGLIQRIDGAGIDVERRLGLGRVAEHRESAWV